MELVLLALGTMVIAAGLVRFTPVHPLAVAVLLAACWAGLFGLVMAMFAVEAWPLGAGLAFAAGTVPAGIGAFLGWLRKTSVAAVRRRSTSANSR